MESKVEGDVPNEKDLKKRASDAIALLETTDNELHSGLADNLFYPICLVRDAKSLLEEIVSGRLNVGVSRIATNLQNALKYIENRSDPELQDAVLQLSHAMDTLDPRLTIDGYNLFTHRSVSPPTQRGR